jgi:hypothetical protein
MMQTFVEKRPSFTPVPHTLLQRQCACEGGNSDDARKKQEGTLQRSALDDRPLGRVPSIVQDVLHSSGQPLDGGTRALVEPRFGHDFSRVRVHTDSRAAESADAVSALAYTVGDQIVFAAGQYAPQSPSGQKLMVHELTHVVQQGLSGQGTAREAGSIGPVGGVAESEAAANAAGMSTAHGLTAAPLAAPLLQRQPSAVDANAQAIIDAAANASVPMATRAPDVVRRILNQYFPADASKVSSILYNQGTIGLSTTYTGTGATLTGIVTVGDQFVNATDRGHIARRVAQLGHEIDHIGQQRSGMGGANRSDEREFLAFYHEALFVEKPGTGSIAHATRVTLIDTALGYYYCLEAALQTQYATNKQDLLTSRATHSGLGGNAPTPAPTTCRRQP